MAGKLTVIIDCPDWCEMDAEKHLYDGNLHHMGPFGTVEVIGDEGRPTTLTVYLSRSDEPTGRGEMAVMLEGWDLTATRTRQFAALLLGAAHVCEQEDAGHPYQPPGAAEPAA